ncbi:GNAT family N-acetyltransferase [Rossellomorea marisflavi]|uniref:GNAT family N-acetyltransferase n=2 Tax=Rossellomorea marisflavi TaxID=189381 RepID=UPI00285362DE|nr:GNAT family N-acetyltransferase [Rossellomorea marisflavi]MDR4938510.1 GNAT family N-acetyltransferase [Rossellomorea marisflavi]
MTGTQLLMETERLVIRPFTRWDYGNWLQSHLDRLPSQHKYDAGYQDMSGCTEQWFAEMIGKQDEMMAKDEVYIFGVFLKATGVMIGTVDVSTLMRYNFNWGRIGYVLHNQHWQKGFGKESVAATLRMAYTKIGYHRIEAHIDLDNVPSISLVESVGMTYECTRKGFIYERGMWQDQLVYYQNAE